jgi:hypothetical protein
MARPTLSTLSLPLERCCPVRRRQPGKEPAIAQLVETMRAKATSDPGYLMLDVWFEGPHQRAVLARTAARARKSKGKAKGLRKVAQVERRPGNVQHTYRYQLHRAAAG